MKISDRQPALSVAVAARNCPSASSAATPQVPTATSATTATGCTTVTPPVCATSCGNWSSASEKWFLKNAFTFHPKAAKH